MAAPACEELHKHRPVGFLHVSQALGVVHLYLEREGPSLALCMQEAVAWSAERGEAGMIGN